MAFLKHFYGRQVLPWYKQAVQYVSDCLASVSHAATPLHMNVTSSLHWYAAIFHRWIRDGFAKVLRRVRTSSRRFPIGADRSIHPCTPTRPSVHTHPSVRPVRPSAPVRTRPHPSVHPSVPSAPVRTSTSCPLRPHPSATTFWYEGPSLAQTSH